MFEFIKNLFVWMHDTWSYVLFKWIPQTMPKFMLFNGTDYWWVDILVGIFWLGIYAGFAWIYFKFVGWPVWKSIRHMNYHGFKVLPWWHLLLYVFIFVYCHTNAPIISLERRSFDITPAVAILPILIYYLVKVKWRIIYFPLLQIMVIVFWVGAIFVFFPIILIMLALTFAGVSILSVFSEERYKCPYCGRVYRKEGSCPYCGDELETIY